MRRCVLVVVMLALAVLVGGSAQAASITFGLDYEFSGADEPESATTPWVTATLDDSFGGTDTVRLTISAVNLTDVETIKNFHLNFDPVLDPTDLSFSVVGIPGAVPVSILTGVNAFMADGDGKFDIQFNFPPETEPPGVRFTMGETVVYDLTYTSDIDISHFQYFSEEGGGAGSYLAAAQILAIGPADNGSGWIGAVPEPATALLLGSGLVGLAAARRRRSL